MATGPSKNKMKTLRETDKGKLLAAFLQLCDKGNQDLTRDSFVARESIWGRVSLLNKIKQFL